MNLVLGLVFVLSLMFLAMIFGERLSLFGLVDGRWLTAPFDMAARFWDMVCEATDRVWCFTFDHFWWVTATVTGGIGVLLVALIMVSGLSNEAKAVRLDERATMNVGSVLDHIPVLETENVLQTKAVADANRVSQLLYQVPSSNRFPIPPSIRRPVITDLASQSKTGFPPRVFDVPPLEMESSRYREPVTPRGRLSISMEPFLERIGRPVRSQKIDQLIQQTVLSLRNDDWRTFSEAQNTSRGLPSLPAMRQDSDVTVRNLYSRVRVVPGEFVSSSNLRVEKSAPDDQTTGEFDLQIRVTNLGRQRINGVVVRELLPATWVPQTMEPRGVYRDAVVTWLLQELQPMQATVLNLRVASTEPGRFQSYTEVSASSAVSTPARIAPAARTSPPVRTNPVRTLPELSPEPFPDDPFPDDPFPDEPLQGRSARPLPPVELPDVRLIMEEPPQRVPVGESIDVYFRVKNVGAAPAEGVSLRVELPLGVGHRALKDDELNRRVDSNVRRLEVGESRRMKLTIRPFTRGRHFTTAELVLKDSQLDMQSFEIVATEPPTQEAPPLRPRPDFE